MVADELIDVLMRFHREIVIPDIRRIVGESVGAVDATLTAFRNETMSHFDSVYKRFDRLESEYDSLSAAAKRIERRPPLHRSAIRSANHEQNSSFSAQRQAGFARD